MQKRRNSKGGTWCLASLILQTAFGLCKNQLHCLLEHQTKVQTALECVKISFILYWSIDQAALWLRC
jgi:hypothetical protein